jgi:hypothetical protein
VTTQDQPARTNGERLLEAYLTSRKFEHHRVETGVYHADFGDGPTAARAMFAAGGPAGPGVLLELHLPKPVPKDDWARALWNINAWNAQNRTPKARLRIEDPRTSEHGTVVLEGWTPIGPGVPFPLVASYLDRTIDGARTFMTGDTTSDDGPFGNAGT